MNVSRSIVFAAALGLGGLTLAGCAATPFKADVKRFQSQLPAPSGQTFTIKASDPALDNGLEFGHYANLVAAELTKYGYRPAAPGATGDLVVSVGYGVDKGRQIVRRDRMYDPFYDPFYGGYYGYGPGWRRPVFVRGAFGYRYIHGFYDPFMWDGDRFGTEVITVYTSGLDVKIDRAADGQRLFEGRAEAASRTKDLGVLVPNLTQAMFTNFPGNSGEKVRITVAPPPKAK